MSLIKQGNYIINIISLFDYFWYQPDGPIPRGTHTWERNWHFQTLYYRHISGNTDHIIIHGENIFEHVCNFSKIGLHQLNNFYKHSYQCSSFL